MIICSSKNKNKDFFKIINLTDLDISSAELWMIDAMARAPNIFLFSVLALNSSRSNLVTLVKLSSKYKQIILRLFYEFVTF